MKTDKYLRLLGKYPGLADAAVTAAYGKEDTLAQVTASVTAPVLFCYVKSVLENAAKSGIKRLYFLARDGYIMKAAADAITEASGYDIETCYLYVSRYALRNALYCKCGTTEDFEKAGFFGHCAVQSAENTLKRAGIDKDERKEVYKRIGFDGDESRIMSDGEFDRFCDMLRSDSTLFETIRERSAPKYEALIAYLRQNGFFDNKRFAVVDSGWLGSVQKTLTQLTDGMIPEQSIIGYYFGLYRKKDDNYRSFLFDISDAHRYVPTFCNNLFECFCSAPHGMTVGYEEKDGAVVPVLNRENKKVSEMADKQTDIVRRFSYAACKEGSQISVKSARKLCAKLLKELMYKPDCDEAKALGAFPFCDDATETELTFLADDCKNSIGNILFVNRLIRKRKGKSIYPDKGMYWLYGSIVLTDCRPKAVYRVSVRAWEKLRLLREKRRLCR